MNDLEFDVLDELYFVQTFNYLIKTLNLEEQILKDTLAQLIQKGWVKCFAPNLEEVLTNNEVDFDNQFKTYHYLATKQGLLAHNTID